MITLQLPFSEEVLDALFDEFDWDREDIELPHPVQMGACSHHSPRGYEDESGGKYMNATAYCGHCYHSSNPASISWDNEGITVTAASGSSKLLRAYLTYLDVEQPSVGTVMTMPVDYVTDALGVFLNSDKEEEEVENAIGITQMRTTSGNNDYKMEQLYAAASSVFMLPDYKEVLSYLNGGPLPELPEHLQNTPFAGYSVGKIHNIKEAYVLITTDGGREITVSENEVIVHFKTAEREASVNAAKEVLEHLHQYTIDEICLLTFEDGRRISDVNITPKDVENVHEVSGWEWPDNDEGISL